MTTGSTDNEIAAVREQLKALDLERQRLEARLVELERERLQQPSTISLTASVTNHSPAEEKIDLFRHLFGGRTDVFPARWENAKTGRSGYAPACFNE